ncbi:MAG: hypothetical protein A2Y40_02025 [Candidatus Margulisbacteria bacterium GWF2_35_9]|nr:MAG: hypothetical protein A2Y40_02025 [Candidatus Margulisbacteria bacterium GWF2_35_9]
MRQRIFNRADDKEKRRILRKNMTEAEIILWSMLKNRNLLGYRFVRQYSVAGFVIDFFCSKLKLAIELDGGIHDIEGAKESDDERQIIIEQYGIIFLRFKNEEIKNSLNDVLIKIKENINYLG